MSDFTNEKYTVGEKSNMNKGKDHKRIELFDVIKCIAIFMVVWGHTALNSELAGDPPLLYKILYSIHMPLFFFLAGLSVPPKALKGRQDRRQFLRKNILTLLFPYLIWALVFCNFDFQNVAWILYGSWQALCKTGTLSSLWYLASFFVAKIYVQLVIALFDRLGWAEKRMHYLIPAAVLLLVGALLPKSEIGYPWCMDNAVIGAAFILMGMALKYRIVEFAVQKKRVLTASLLGALAVYVAVIMLMGDRFTICLMCSSSYGDPVSALILALTGGFAVIVIAMLLKQLTDEWITGISLSSSIYVGQHTMGIFLLHKPMMQQLFLPCLRNLIGQFCPESVIRFLGAWIALLAALWLCRLIEHYVPELVGIFSPDIIKGQKEA